MFGYDYLDFISSVVLFASFKFIVHVSLLPCHDWRLVKQSKKLGVSQGSWVLVER